MYRGEEYSVTIGGKHAATITLQIIDMWRRQNFFYLHTIKKPHTYRLTNMEYHNHKYVPQGAKLAYTQMRLKIQEETIIFHFS